MNAKDAVDTKSIDFWVIPWKIVTIGLIILILIIWFLVWISSHIQWKKEKQASPPPPPPVQNIPPPIPPQNPVA
jgi:hypothetical protein